MRFIRVQDDIYNVDDIVSVWFEQPSAESGRKGITHLTLSSKQSTARYTSDLRQEIWELLIEAAANDPSKRITVGKNIIVQEALDS